MDRTFGRLSVGCKLRAASGNDQTGQTDESMRALFGRALIGSMGFSRSKRVLIIPLCYCVESQFELLPELM